MAQDGTKKALWHYTRLLKKVFPNGWRRQLVSDSALNIKVKKLFFWTFVLFLLTTILVEPHGLASRDLAQRTQQWKYQLIVGIRPTSHNALTERLNTIEPTVMDQLLDQALRYARGHFHGKTPTVPNMKVFDVTTWSVSYAHYDWAANNGPKGALRFLFVMDVRTGLPERVVDASRSTSDNDVFETALTRTHPGNVINLRKW